MIDHLSHMTIYVLDQDKALEFYRDKLGFEVRTDFSMDGGFRWLTVGPPGQKDLELILMAPSEQMLGDAESVNALHKLIRGGKLGAGVFYTKDCRKTYAELKEKGVNFTAEPAEKFYGIEAMFRDDSGNWFSLTERTAK